MASQDLLLCIDIGTNSIKASEFSYSPDGNMMLERFAFAEYTQGQVGLLDNAATGAAEDNLGEVLATLFKENQFAAKKVHLSISGQNAYVRFVKVPSMMNNERKLHQIIEYEAESAIPFSMNEVIWDSQLLSSESDSDEVEAMLVIVKSDEVDRISNLIESHGKEIALIEVAPTACYNAASANNIGEKQCELILNIGDRCSPLIFVDQGRVFIRIIPIAGHSITLQISKEFGIPYEEAEKMKRKHGFVALGGAYEEPDSEVAATVSKIVRNVMTRLHGEISRSINIYRSQQKGRKPEKLWLSGGSSVMGYTPHFFSEKLKIPVEYFNPFKNIGISDNIDKGVLADVAHRFSETVGLALRHNMNCPLELSLIPKTMKLSLEFRTKTPYLYAALGCLVLCLLVTFFGFQKQLEIAKAKQEIAAKFLKDAKAHSQQLSSAEGELNSAKGEYEEASKILAERTAWPELLNEVQKALPDNVWLTEFRPVGEKGAVQTQAQGESGGLFGESQPKAAVAAVPSVYKAVQLKGHGLVSDYFFNDTLQDSLSKAPCFKYDRKTDSVGMKLWNATFTDFNVATFELTVPFAKEYKR